MNKRDLQSFDLIRLPIPRRSRGHDSAVINAGLLVEWSPRLSTYVSYDGQLGRARYDSNGVSGGIRYTF